MVESLAAIGEAIAASTVLGSLADWLFAGVLVHSRYGRHPEIWRGAGGETRRIVAAQALCLMSSTAMVLLAIATHQTDLAAVVRLAVAIWLIAPLPIFVTNQLFLKMDLMVTIAHSVGWLAKLLLAALVIAALSSK